VIPIIINKKFRFNFSPKKKKKKKKKIILKNIDGTEYKILNKCKSFIILNNTKIILKYRSLYNHFEKEFDTSISIAKHKIKDEIKKNSIPLNIKVFHCDFEKDTFSEAE